MDQRRVARYGARYADLPSEKQTEFLARLDRNEAWNGTSIQKFFRLVVSHTMQGFYGDPRHGGNLNRVSWKLGRLSYLPVRVNCPGRRPSRRLGQCGVGRRPPDRVVKHCGAAWKPALWWGEALSPALGFLEGNQI